MFQDAHFDCRHPKKDIPATTTCPYCPKTETSEDTGLEYDVSYDYETLVDHIRKAHQYQMIDFRSTKHPIQERDQNVNIENCELTWKCIQLGTLKVGKILVCFQRREN